MPADFAMSAKHARLQIPVPPLDLQAVRRRSEESGARARLRRLIFSITVLLGIAGAGAAFASIGGGIHVWLFENKAVATVQSFAQVRHPMAADVRAIAAKTAFPLVLPAGVPNAAHVLWIMYDPADKPNLISISYQGANGGHYMGVTLVDTAKIAADRAMMPGGPPQGVTSTKPAARWQIGRELVFVQSLHLSVAQIARIKQAMQTQTAAQTQAEFEARLPKVAIQLPDPKMWRVGEIAERIAPPGTNVLLGTFEIHELPRIAAAAKPLRDGRTVYATSIPQVHGVPDYRNAQLYWPKAIAISADGVRAVAATLQRTQTGPACGCAILVHQSGGAYAIWKIDEKTLKVTRL